MRIRNARVSSLPLPIFCTDEEEWDIISLPDNLCTVNPIHTSAKKIQNFLKTIENKNDIFTQNLGATLNEINKEIEDLIRIKCKILKRDLKLIIFNGQNYISYYLNPYNTEILSFDDFKFEKCRKHCTGLLSQGKSLIYNFYAFLKGVEKIRCEKFKEVLMNSYNELLKINTKSPYEIQLFLENHILAYNQVVLANLRNYKEIAAHLLLVYVNEIKLMLYKVSKFEECWKVLCKNEIINRLKEYKVNTEEVENVLFKNETILNIIKLFNNKIEVILEQMECSPETKPQKWLDNMDIALKNLDSTAKQLITVYKLAADELYNKYYVGSETVMEKMINKQITSLAEISEINKSLGDPLNNVERKRKEYSVAYLNKLWTETVEFILQALYTKFTFLEELEKLFLNHECRLNQVKRLIIQDYKKLILKHDKLLLQGKDEADLSIILDNLRRGSTRNFLNNDFKRAQNILIKIGQIIDKQKDEQIRIVKKFYDFMNNELVILKTDLMDFIEKYTEEPIISKRKELDRMEYKSMFEVLTQTRENFNEIGIWKSKILEYVEFLMILSTQEQQNKAEQWVSEQEEYIITNFESKVDFHKCRYDRIKIDVFNVRLAEIEMHETRFTSHINVIQELLENLTREHSNFENVHSSYAIKLYKYVEYAEIDKLEITKGLETSLLTSQTVIEKEVKAFEDVIKNHTEYVNTEVDGMYSQNLLFLKSMILFHEGGNFSSTEVKLFTKKMRNTNTQIKKKAILLNSKVKIFHNKICIQLHEVRAKFEERKKYATLFIDFKNSVKSQFVNIQTTIKNVVVETKTAINKTQILNERTLKLLKLRSNPYLYLSYVIGNCKELNKHFSQHLQHLLDFESAPRLRPLPLRYSSSASTSKKSSVSVTRSAVTLKPETYKLFDNEMELDFTENKFLSKIRTILLTNFRDLERKGKKFYSVVKLEDCIMFNISQQLRSFMWGVLHKFTYYYLQSLQIWIIEIRDLVSLMHNLRKMLEEFCERYMKQIHESQVELLERTWNKHLMDIKQNMDSGLSSIKNTSDQLKPLYGYPGNQKMLNDLTEKMTIIFKQIEHSFKTCLIEPKIYVKNVLNNYLEVLTNGKNKIEELHNILPKKQIYESLGTQVKNIMFITNFDNLGMPLHCTDIIDNSEVDVGNINSIILQIDQPRSTPEEWKDTLLQIFAEILGEKVEKIVDLESEFFKAIPKLKRNWIENVEKVIELYKIKYN